MHKFIIIINLCFLAACGTDTSKNKSYHLAFVGSDYGLYQTFQGLIDNFNQSAGKTVLFLETDATKASSQIQLVENMVNITNFDGIAENGILGDGRPVISQSQTKFGFKTADNKNYSMVIKFDLHFIQNSRAKGLAIIFDHEVGHGLEMQHTANIKDIMYPNCEITDTDKDFDGYFKAVRNYVGDL